MTTKIINTRFGEFEIFAEQDLISKSMQTYGEWAQEEIELLQRFLQPGDTVFDIGGFIGTHARAFSQSVGPTGRVVSFEALAQNYTLLKENARLAEFSNIEAVNLAVGATNQNIFMENPSSKNRGANRIRVDDLSEGESNEQIALDDTNYEGPRLIKIDVEGHEAAVLTGAKSLIASARPIIFAESNRLDESVGVLEFAAEHDFSVFGINTSAFSPENFNGYANDIFGSGTECGVLLVPSEQVKNYTPVLDKLAHLDGVDDLALLLMNKPQYSSGLLHELSAAKVLEVPFVDLEGKLAADLVATKSQLDQAQTEHESKLAQMKREHESKLAQMKREHESKLAQMKREQAAVTSRLANALEVVRNAKLLAKATQKVPFGIYFNRRRKYRRIIKNIKAYGSETGFAGEAVSDKTDQPSHPAGYRGDILRNLTPLISRIVVGPTGSDEEPEAGNILTGLQATSAISSSTLILSFSHDDYTSVVGGTQLCLQMEALAAKNNGLHYLNLYPETALRTMAPESDSANISLDAVLNGIKIGRITYREVAEQIADFVSSGGQVRIIVHHLLGHSPEQILNIADAAGQDTAWVWAHDYFTLCPSVNLLRNDVLYCDAPAPDSPACGICVYGQERDSHLKRLDHLFQSLNIHILSPSKVTADLWMRRSSQNAASVHVVPHISLDWEARLREAPQDHKGPIKIAFLGATVSHKGWEIFTRLYNIYKDNPQFEFIYLGMYKINETMECRNVVVSTENPTAMSDAIRDSKIDLVIHFAIWPETFSFTTYEAMAGGAGVLTNPVSGNIAAEVEKSGLGAVLDDFEALEQFLCSSDAKQLVEKIRAHRTAKSAVASLSDMSLPYVMGELPG